MKPLHHALVPQPLALMTCFALSGLPVFAADIFVSPNGKDTNPGTLAAPLQTLQAAQMAARKVAGREPVTVNLKEGVYYLPDTLVLTAEDSGSKAAPVLWQAASGETPVISGGTPLQLTWKPYKDGIFQAQVPTGFETDQLFVNGERQILARYPNANPAKAEVFDGYAPDAISPERIKNWTDPAGGYFHALHPGRWGGFSYLITGKDADGKLKYEGGWQGNRAAPPATSFAWWRESLKNWIRRVNGFSTARPRRCIIIRPPGWI